MRRLILVLTLAVLGCNGAVPRGQQPVQPLLSSVAPVSVQIWNGNPGLLYVTVAGGNTIKVQPYEVPLPEVQVPYSPSITVTAYYFKPSHYRFPDRIYSAPPGGLISVVFP